ncbi:MAG: hypothetical protein Q9168_006111 [Polycauliona sp. 1 TL-2023]
MSSQPSSKTPSKFPPNKLFNLDPSRPYLPTSTFDSTTDFVPASQHLSSMASSNNANIALVAFSALIQQRSAHFKTLASEARTTDGQGQTELFFKERAMEMDCLGNLIDDWRADIMQGMIRQLNLELAAFYERGGGDGSG